MIFEEIDLELDDYLEIYDGIYNINSQILLEIIDSSFNSYDITSSDSINGALTLNFISEASSTKPDGWKASITCCKYFLNFCIINIIIETLSFCGI